MERELFFYEHSHDCLLKGGGFAKTENSHDEAISDVSQNKPVKEVFKNSECCSDDRCNIWFDMSRWFGYNCRFLDSMKYQRSFTNIANGGSGLYEKLAVIGSKTLEVFAEAFFLEQFEKSQTLTVPVELNTPMHLELVKLLYAHKQVERLLSPHGLFLFGKGYLTSCQSISQRTAVVRHVKALIGYASQSLDSQSLYDWLPTLIDHVQWISSIKTEGEAGDNLLLQDLQDYFGYQNDELVPRIRKILENGATSALPKHAPSTHDLLQLYAKEYFEVLAEELTIPAVKRAAWVNQEITQLFDGPALAHFSCVYLTLFPFLSTDTRCGQIQDYENVCRELISACWMLSTETKSKKWMATLIQRLRQIHLLFTLKMTKSAGALMGETGGQAAQSSVNLVDSFQVLSTRPVSVESKPTSGDHGPCSSTAVPANGTDSVLFDSCVEGVGKILKKERWNDSESNVPYTKYYTVETNEPVEMRPIGALRPLNTQEILRVWPTPVDVLSRRVQRKMKVPTVSSDSLFAASCCVQGAPNGTHNPDVESKNKTQELKREKNLSALAHAQLNTNSKYLHIRKGWYDRKMHADVPVVLPRE